MEIPEIVTISDARAGLSRILSDLSNAGPDASPVLIGAHRKPQGVLLSIEAFEALSGRAERRGALASTLCASISWAPSR
jgi:PHD/YefM family antitoxin component YafN of YafNO toxin-antitoxin module